MLKLVGPVLQRARGDTICSSFVSKASLHINGGGLASSIANDTREGEIQYGAS